MTIDQKLKELQTVRFEKPDSVLSMYLNTDPSQEQGKEWKIQLKNGLNSFENYLERSDDQQELNNFKKVRSKIENYINENQLDLQKSVVIFASADDSVWFAEHLQMSVKTEFHWQETAVTDQMYQLMSMFPRLGIIMVQKSQAKVIDAELGSVLQTQHFVLDTYQEEWIDVEKEKRFDYEDDETNQLFNGKNNRWYKRLATKLDKLVKEYDWERVYLVGDKQETKDIEHYMNKQVDKLENRNILDHEESKVLEKIVA